ncbi:DNA primase [Vibrio phage D479]
MSLLVEIQYAKMLQHRLTLPKVVSNRPFKLNARCPVCGDSRKKKHLCRFWINEVKDKHGIRLRVGCWNCDYNETLSTFLKDHEPALFAQYRVEMFKESNSRVETPKETQVEEPVVEEQEPEQEEPKVIATSEQSKLFHRITDLKEDHVLRKYVKHRQIPEDKWHLLGFTRTWTALAKKLRPDLYPGEITEDHPRLVIPIYNSEGLIAVQGRALTNKHTQRYMTIKIDPDFNKIYGTERVDESKPVIFVEGPIDSLFLDNSCAIVGGSVSPKNAPYPGQRIWCLDNEPHHPDVVKRMAALIRAGERVVIWDRLPMKIMYHKDINDMVKAGFTAEFLQDYILKNAVSGLMATNRLNNWKRI